MSAMLERSCNWQTYDRQEGFAATKKLRNYGEISCTQGCGQIEMHVSGGRAPKPQNWIGIHGSASVTNSCHGRPVRASIRRAILGPTFLFPLISSDAEPLLVPSREASSVVPMPSACT